MRRRFAFMFFLGLAGALLLLDYNTQWLDPVRRYFSNLLLPTIHMSRWSVDMKDQAHLQSLPKEELIQQLVRLEARAAGRAFELQRLNQLIAENARLRDVLELREVQQQPVVVAQVLLTRIQPLAHKIFIDKGLADGVQENSILFDAKGVMGQVHEVSEHQSWATLITDPQHAMPVELMPSGARGVLAGVASLTELRLQYVPETSPVVAGDQVMTSGFGGRFPVGYPVGVVTKVSTSGEQSFADIQVTPLAALSTMRFVLVMAPVSVAETP